MEHTIEIGRCFTAEAPPYDAFHEALEESPLEGPLTANKSFLVPTSPACFASFLVVEAPCVTKRKLERLLNARETHRNTRSSLVEQGMKVWKSKRVSCWMRQRQEVQKNLRRLDCRENKSWSVPHNVPGARSPFFLPCCFPPQVLSLFIGLAVPASLSTSFFNSFPLILRASFATEDTERRRDDNEETWTGKLRGCSIASPVCPSVMKTQGVQPLQPRKSPALGLYCPDLYYPLDTVLPQVFTVRFSSSHIDVASLFHSFSSCSRSFC